MNRPRVSVCVATYNQAAYLADCVLSVIAQAESEDLEILVGDDCSTDGTSDIVAGLARRYRGQVIAVPRTRNLGSTGNYQDLVRRATGEFIAHVDGDDAWLPGKLRAQLGYLAAHPDCAAVYTNGIAVDTRGQLRGLFSQGPAGRIDLAQLCAKGNFLLHSSMLYRAPLRDAYLALDTPAIDWAIHMALARRGPLGVVDCPLVLYRVGTQTSMVRSAFGWMERQLWTALAGALPELEPAQRGRAAAHFLAQVLIARALGKTEGAAPLVREIASAAGMSPGRLCLAALPDVLATAGHGAVRSLLRALGAVRLGAEHYRI